MADPTPSTPSTQDSILNSVKKYCNVDPSYDVFDDQLIPLINGSLNTVAQLGAGISSFSISDATATWDDFLGESRATLHNVESLVKIKVRLMFDPPSNSFVTDALRKEADELTWRINVQVDPKPMSPNSIT